MKEGVKKLIAKELEGKKRRKHGWGPGIMGALKGAVTGMAGGGYGMIIGAALGAYGGATGKWEPMW